MPVLLNVLNNTIHNWPPVSLERTAWRETLSTTETWGSVGHVMLAI